VRIATVIWALVVQAVMAGLVPAIHAVQAAAMQRWRTWKIRLIVDTNPDWCDLYYDLE
jgi:hypothetical protein